MISPAMGVLKLDLERDARIPAPGLPRR